MTVTTDYINYFRHLAKMHPALNHQQESGSVTFDVVLQNQIKDLALERTSINPASNTLMLLVIPTLEIQDSEDAQGMRNYTGAFFILRKFQPRTNSRLSWWSAMGAAEEIGIQICERMVRDSNSKHPLFSRSIDKFGNLNARFIERIVDDKWYGHLVTFNFQTKLSCSNIPCEWRDGGISPHYY